MTTLTEPPRVLAPAANRRRWVPAAAVGLAAATLALGVGELIAGLLPGGRSPVIAVGDAVIDAVPTPVKDFGIAVFGTGDKAALLTGILLLSAAFAAVIGVVAARRLAAGAAGLALFGVLGATAAVANPVTTPEAAATPSLAAGAAGVAALAFLLRRLPPAAPGPVAGQTSSGDTPGRPEPAAPTRVQLASDSSRRRFLRTLGVVGLLAAGGAASGRWLQARASATASRAAVVLGRAAQPLPALPAAAELDVEGLSPFFTPNADFYRIDTALQVPQVAAEDWSMQITGMVDNPITLRYDDLRARELVEADVTLACVSNEVGGQLVGNARWLGAPLAALLAEAGVRAGATQLVARSVDGFTVGFPTEAALDGRVALVAIGMNGEALPVEHGFPARLVVAGLYGYVSATKWLAEIELTTWEAFDAYWVPRGWSKEAPVKTQSRIDVPRPGAQVTAGRVRIAGVAWAQTRGVQAVEVQIDGGDWLPAQLAEEVTADTWRQWVLDWDAAAGDHVLVVRATDATGQTQPEERQPPAPDGATGYHRVRVGVTPA